MERFCDKAVTELRDYCCKSEPEDKTRFSKLLLRLSPLRSLQPDVLEELFFAGLIGNVQIDSVIPYILKMEASEYQSQYPTGRCYTQYTLVHICEISLHYRCSK